MSQKCGQAELSHVQQAGVEVIASSAAKADIETRRIVLDSGAEIDYGQLVVATGAVADRDRVPGARGPCALSLRPGRRGGVCRSGRVVPQPCRRRLRLGTAGTRARIRGVDRGSSSGCQGDHDRWRWHPGTPLRRQGDRPRQTPTRGVFGIGDVITVPEGCRFAPALRSIQSTARGVASNVARAIGGDAPKPLPASAESRLNLEALADTDSCPRLRRAAGPLRPEVVGVLTRHVAQRTRT